MAYNIADGSVMDSESIMLATKGSCAYVDNVVYFVDSQYGMWVSYDVAKAKQDTIASPKIKDGKLVNFRGKLAIFGGNDDNGNPSKVIKVYDKDKNNWDTEIAYDSQEMASSKTKSLIYV